PGCSAGFRAARSTPRHLHKDLGSPRRARLRNLRYGFAVMQICDEICEGVRVEARQRPITWLTAKRERIYRESRVIAYVPGSMPGGRPISPAFFCISCLTI